MEKKDRLISTLNLAAKDTRHGLDEETRRTLVELKKEADPSGKRKAYVDRFEKIR